jgi:HK97 family phage major capsid protein
MNKKNMTAMLKEYRENCERIRAIADLCAKENRERNEKENEEYSMLVRQNGQIEMLMQAAKADYLRENPNAKRDAEKMLRENVRNGQKTEITFMRDMMTVANVTSGGIIPLSVEDILKPLNEGFILDKVGISMPTGLVGDYVWPIYEMVEASVMGEGVALGDTKIEFSKLTASPERVGLAIPVTNQALNQTDGILETIVKEIMPQAIQQLLNKIVFGLTKVTGASNLVGPFADIVANKSSEIVSLSATPTFKELNAKMKAAVLETGIEGSAMCWVMTKSMAAVLEGTPINEKGVYIPMLQDGKLCGLPVYTTNVMRGSDGAEYIGLGDWRYQPMGLFNSLRFIVDPYSQARKDSVDFVLNADYGTKTLRPEAFKLGKATTA